MKDPYAVLGVSRDADQDTIKKAYKKLAKRYHPDVSKEPEADRKFKEVNEAWDILKDPEKRRRFDTFGTSGGSMPGGSPYGGGGGAGGFSGFRVDFGDGEGIDVEDMLSSMFGAGAGRGRGRGRRGSDHQAVLKLSPMLSFIGGESTVSVGRPEGYTEDLRVRIPPGVSHGGTLRLRGRGGQGRGDGPPGDLILKLEIEDHPLLKRDGYNLELELPITLGEAARGASVTVPTPTGEVSVKIPAGAADGQRLRLRGKGVQRKGAPGDLYLTLRLRMPSELDEEALAAIDVIEQKYSTPVREDLEL